MKYVLAVVALSFSLSTQAAELTLREHMAAMVYILDSIWLSTTDAANYPKAADKTAEMREHLTQAIGLKPGKLQSLNPTQRRQAVIEYHQLMAQIIHLSATLERTLAAPDLDPVSGSRQRDVQNLLREISVVIARGHEKFR